MKRSAVLSDDGLYRYGLVRRWSTESAFATFVMLNPSTADADVDDPTIRQCIAFAQHWGMGALHVCNLYAFRTSQPDVLWAAHRGGVNIVGQENDRYLIDHAKSARLQGWPMVAAWGNNARPDRVNAVLDLPWMTGALECLGTTQSGAPKHPLARGKHRIPIDFERQSWPS